MKCFVCKEDNACIKCCDKFICLLHFYCTIHWTHPSNAVIFDENIYKKYKPEVTEFVERIKSDLVKELLEEEKKPIYDEDTYDATQRTETVPVNLWKLSAEINHNEEEEKKQEEPPSPPPKRSKIEVKPTGKDFRLYVKDELLKSLKNRITSEDRNINESDVIERINRIEEELFAKHKTSDDDKYRNFCRALKQHINNKSNTTFYKIILDNKVSPSAIVNMSNEDMLDIKDKLMLQQFGNDSLPIIKEQINKTKEVNCPKCGNNDCSYVYIKAPKDIAKGETWGSKDTPDIVTKLTCQKCSHSWNVENANLQGQSRLSQYYEFMSQEQRAQYEAEVVRRCVSRGPKQCLFFDMHGYKIIYRRYAALFFIVGVGPEDRENELGIFEFIQTYVETLNAYFGQVTEMDILFNFEKVHMILDEMILSGSIVETNKENILKPFQLMKLAKDTY